MRYRDAGGRAPRSRRAVVCLLIAGLILIGTSAYQSLMGRDLAEAGNGNGRRIKPSGTIMVGPAVLMTPAQMDAFVGPPPPRHPAAMVNRPSMPLEDYYAAKAANSMPTGEAAARAGGMSLSTLTVNSKFQGAIEGENGYYFDPPDVDGAVGPTQVLQTSNDSIDVWSKGGGHLRSVSENGFLGNFNDGFTDGRAIYDPLYSRWVMVILDENNLTSSGKPNLYLAISQTPDATGAFFIFAVNMNTNISGLFPDYPELGMDQDSLLLTVNMFNGNTNVGPAVFAVPKARAYNGLGFGFVLFGPLSNFPGVIAPPFDLDNNGLDYFLQAPGTAGTRSTLNKFTMTASDRSTVSFSGPVSIPLPTGVTYTVPPPDAQETCIDPNTGSTALLDSLDGRFQNRSYQYSSSLWAVHTVAIGGRPVPRFYQINPATNTMVQTGTFTLSATSNDFNPSIAANSVSSAIVTWSATDPTNAKNAQVMFGGRLSGTAINTMPVGGSLASSSACLVDNFQGSRQRWGDYSVIDLDNSNIGSGTFWLINEWSTTINLPFGLGPTTAWTTEIGSVHP